MSYVNILMRIIVTLYARVWIETNLEGRYDLEACVTLYARVWIETLAKLLIKTPPNKSPSTRGCGLKQHHFRKAAYLGTSPSTRGCGLKPTPILLIIAICQSPSTRGCGLKLKALLSSSALERHPLREGVD